MPALVTAMRMRLNDLTTITTWKGKQRNLCIWDEAIQPAASVGISYSDLVLLHRHLEAVLIANSMTSDVSDSLKALKRQTQKMMGFIEDNISELSDISETVVVNNESDVSSDQQVKLRELLNSNKFFGKSNAAQHTRANAVLELIGLSCRALSSARKTLPDGDVDKRSCGLTSFFVNVPTNLKNISGS